MSLLPGQRDRLQILAAAQAHLLRCFLGQRPLRASSRVRASHLRRSPSSVAYPAVRVVDPKQFSLIRVTLKKQVPGSNPLFGGTFLATWFVGICLCTITLVTLAETVPGSRAVDTGVSTSHWAFVPPRDPTLINSGASNGAVSAVIGIDALVRAQLDRLQIEPVGSADKTALLRRVTYDLTGLPTTPAELKEFLADKSPGAYEKVVDRLLASPAFGERWAQHWLDLAHYADSNGFELDVDRPDAWRYRDWVVKAINEDMPYDRFLSLQVVGDEVEPGNHEAMIASGFARSGPFEIVAGNIDPEVRRNDELTAATSTVGSVFLGLTVGCARCHDHKFDPIPTADYYRLQAFFAGAHHTETPIHPPEEQARFDAEIKGIKALMKPLEEAKTKLEEPYKNRLEHAKEAALTTREREIRAIPKERRTPEEARLFEGISVALKVTWEEIAEEVAHHPADHPAREAFKRQLYELELRMPHPPARAMSMMEDEKPLPETRILRRGDVKSKREVVSPAPPSVLLSAMGGDSFNAAFTAVDAKHSGRRLALARWLVARDNPLTARVIVNRLWMHHFGRGLVATPSDFGTKGSPPSNPQLLDWLACELIRQDWRLKSIHRLIVTSKAYQRASGQTSRSGVEKDPENRFLWKMAPRRMEAEGLRDSMLAVSGILNPKRGGPGVRIPLEPEVRDLIFTEAEIVDLWPVEPNPQEQARRSIYVHRKRNVHYPLFDAFDAPDMLTSCPQRPVSTHAPQALVMLNSGFAQQTAAAFAQSLLDHSADSKSRIREAYVRCYSRTPSSKELRLTLDFLRSNSGTDLDRWTDLTLALINSNEFVYVP